MPPDRKKDGLWLERDAGFNIGAALVARTRPLRWLRREALERVASARMSEVGIRANALREAVGRLSGGNQQRVLLGRSLESRPQVLLLNDFTRGVDVRAKAAIHQLVRSLAGTGLAICISSSDLEELLGVPTALYACVAGALSPTGEAMRLTSELCSLSFRVHPTKSPLECRGIGDGGKPVLAAGKIRLSEYPRYVRDLRTGSAQGARAEAILRARYHEQTRKIPCLVQRAAPPSSRYRLCHLARGEEIAMLVHGAALDSHVGPQRRQRLFETRRAVDDDQLRRRQSTPDEIVEQRAPGRLALLRPCS